MSNDSLARRLKRGVAGGLAVASIYCIWITILYLLKGPDPFDRHGLSFPNLLLVYLVGGGLGGAVIGACRPWGQSPVGRRVIAIFALLPVIFGLELLIAGTPTTWGTGEWLIVVGLATAFGWFMADSFFGRDDKSENNDGVRNFEAEKAMPEADVSILKARITEVVLRHLSEITLIDKDRIKLTDWVVKDLKADGDDLSFLFAPGVERDLGVVLTDEQWQRMRTVGDIIATFESVMSPPTDGQLTATRAVGRSP